MADAALVASLLFASAGTLWWRGAWALVVVMLVVRAATVLVVSRVSPALVAERARAPVHGDQPPADRVLVLAVIATGLLGLPIVAGCDVFRWRLLPQPGPIAAAVGLALFTLGWGLKGLALREIAFATTVVRLQRERGHAVVGTGVYRIVRHPFYAGTLLVLAGQGLWLRSWAALASAVVPAALVMARIALEERFLRRELPGYSAYAARVRHRLVPGIW